MTIRPAIFLLRLPPDPTNGIMDYNLNVRTLPYDKSLMDKIAVGDIIELEDNKNNMWTGFFLVKNIDVSDYQLNYKTSYTIERVVIP